MVFSLTVFWCCNCEVFGEASLSIWNCGEYIRWTWCLLWECTQKKFFFMEIVRRFWDLLSLSFVAVISFFGVESNRESEKSRISSPIFFKTPLKRNIKKKNRTRKSWLFYFVFKLLKHIFFKFNFLLCSFFIYYLALLFWGPKKLCFYFHNRKDHRIPSSKSQI